MRTWLWISLSAIAVAGCGTTPPVQPVTVAVSDQAWQAVLDGAARQIGRCYRGPRVGYTGRQIVTRVRLFVTPDGAVAGRPSVVTQVGLTATNRIYAERMAAAAIDAVVRCAPLRLPEGFAANGPFELDLTFSPSASA